MSAPDPTSLEGLGATTLQQGIQFLYAQAGEILRRRRERRAEDSPVEIPPEADAVLKTAPEPRQIDPGDVERWESFLTASTEALKGYADGSRPVDPRDTRLRQVVDGLRRTLELLLGQPLTFKEEPRVDVEIDAEGVDGYVAGIEADSLQGLNAEVTMKIRDSSGTIRGIRKIGG